MRRRRLLRLPPAWVKLGGRVLYRSAELDAFVEKNVVQLSKPGNDADNAGHPPSPVSTRLDCNKR